MRVLSTRLIRDPHALCAGKVGKIRCQVLRFVSADRLGNLNSTGDYRGKERHDGTVWVGRHRLKEPSTRRPAPRDASMDLVAQGRRALAQ